MECEIILTASILAVIGDFLIFFYFKTGLCWIESLYSALTLQVGMGTRIPDGRPRPGDFPVISRGKKACVDLSHVQSREPDWLR